MIHIFPHLNEDMFWQRPGVEIPLKKYAFYLVPKVLHKKETVRVSERVEWIRGGRNALLVSFKAHATVLRNSDASQHHQW